MRRVGMTALLLLAAACSGTDDGGSSPTAASQSEAPNESSAMTEPPTTTLPATGPVAEPIRPAYGADGNGVASLTGPFATPPVTERYREARILRLDLPADNVVAVAYDDGEVRLVAADEDRVKVRSTPGPTGLIYTSGPAGVDVLAPLPDQAPHSRPAVLDGGQLAYVTESGDLVVWDGGEVGRAAVDALVDGDVLTDDQGRLLVLTGPTDRYAHGILGDPLEAAGFVIVSPPAMTVTTAVAVPPPAVIEGRRALWVDIDGDGMREIQVTVSDSSGGARLLVYDEAGNVKFEGAAIGLGNRWRHQVGFGQFSDDPMGVEVITPHIGGRVSFNQYDATITSVGQTNDYTSHGIGSRELDGAVAVDIDGDGTLELVLPTQDRRELVAIGLRDGTPAVVWRSELGATMSSNIAVGTRNGVPTIAVGTTDGTIYFWSALR